MTNKVRTFGPGRIAKTVPCRVFPSHHNEAFQTAVFGWEFRFWNEAKFDQAAAPDHLEFGRVNHAFKTVPWCFANLRDFQRSEFLGLGRMPDRFGQRVL